MAEPGGVDEQLTQLVEEGHHRRMGHHDRAQRGGFVLVLGRGIVAIPGLVLRPDDPTVVVIAIKPEVALDQTDCSPWSVW
jgi:hypothetical protein